MTSPAFRPQARSPLFGAIPAELAASGEVRSPTEKSTRNHSNFFFITIGSVMLDSVTIGKVML